VEADDGRPSMSEALDALRRGPGERMPVTDSTYPAEDARDRRAALGFAGALAYADPDRAGREWRRNADLAYRWLKGRDTLRPVTIEIVPGTPRPEGTTVTTVFNLNDTDEVTLTLTGLDAKGAPVPLPEGFTAAWTLADPDSSGAVLTPSADTSSAVLGAGTPDANVMVSVAVTDPEGNVLNGAEAFIIQPTAATTVGIVPGTPTPEAPPA
jgi:hypothetical protein